MNWDAVGALGQMLSALALILVFIQVRHAHGEMRRSARQDRLDAMQQSFLAAATHPQLASVLERLASSGGARVPFIEYAIRCGLTESEGRQAHLFLLAGWQAHQGAIESIELLSPGVQHDLDSILRRVYGETAVGAKWFELMKAGLNPDAMRYIERVLTAQPR